MEEIHWYVTTSLSSRLISTYSSGTKRSIRVSILSNINFIILICPHFCIAVQLCTVLVILCAQKGCWLSAGAYHSSSMPSSGLNHMCLVLARPNMSAFLRGPHTTLVRSKAIPESVIQFAHSAIISFNFAAQYYWGEQSTAVLDGSWL